MPFNENILLLSTGKVSPDDAVRQALDMAKAEDLKAEEKWAKVEIDCSIFLSMMRTRLLKQQLLENVCQRAYYLANLVDQHGEYRDGFYYNRSHHTLGTCPVYLKGENLQCLRDLSGHAGQDTYTNCPSIHAAGWLTRRATPEAPLLWVEAGCGKDSSGAVIPRLKPSAEVYTPSNLYRCSMCLKHALSLNVTEFAYLNWDAQDHSLVYGSVPAHLSTLRTIAIANDLKNGVMTLLDPDLVEWA